MMILTLEDQENGELVDFDLIDEEDLPFLDKGTDIGLQLRRCVIDSSMDDDVMTDDELTQGAQAMLLQSLREAVDEFTTNRGANNIRNLQPGSFC